MGSVLAQLPVVLSLSLLCSSSALGQERVDAGNGVYYLDGAGPFVPMGFVVVRSTSDYVDALRFAKRASRRLGVPLDLRGLIHDADHGLTWSRESCAADPLYPYPCYTARGRWEGTKHYISIERSDAYRSMRPELFVVIAATGEPKEMQAFAASVRATIPDAYAKAEDVYHGCMH